MKIKVIIFFVFFTRFVFGQKSDTIIKPIKKEFFPLAVGNKYIYSIKSKNKKNNISGYDTVIVLNKSLEKGYKIFNLNNGIVYYLKNDSVFYRNPMEFQNHTYKPLYFETKDSYYPFFHGSCAVTRVETSFMASYKQDQKKYVNCYKFYFPSENKVVIVARGIGIIEMLQNGVTKKLLYIELH
ncbi:MAG: hypothetical protein H7141_09145 [Burkholderiales bacterium]|nr:hypothetical protein [Bacteroidia bacterium]